MKPNKTTAAAELRRRAEEQLQNQTSSTDAPLAAHETLRLLQELKIHQIELEMQNDELRHSKAELEASRERFIDLYDFAPVGYCLVSEEGLILDANLTAANLLGVARGELVQQSMCRFILKEDQDIYYLIRKQLFEKGEPQVCDIRLVRNAETSFWAHLETTIARDDTGRTVSRLVLSDISDRKRIEKAFNEIHRQNQEILESITDACIAISDDMVVSYINSAAERMFGRKRSDVIGRKLFDVFPEGKGAIFEKNFSQAIRTKSAMSFQAELTVAPYQNWYDVRVFPRPEGITIYIQVITERIRAKEKVAKLESVNRQLQKAESLARMAGAIAHHFNNRLFAVMGYLDLAIDGLTAGDASKTNLTIARQEAGKAAEVSKLMLTYLGQVTGKPELLDLSEVCRKILPLLEATLPKNVVLETNLQSPGPVIKANADQIRQVLTNLFTNAWEAVGDDPGAIHLAVKKVFPADIPTSHRFPIDWRPDATPYACLEIRDNGCGIADQDIEEVFSPFFSTKFTGRGLGLSVVLGVVKAYCGVVTAESSPGQGSVFRVFLPISVEEIVQQPDEIEKDKRHQETGKVLLVDDDEVVLKISSLMLSALGFTVLTAMDGIEAVEVFRQHRNEIRLVLSDVSMPRMDGWETLHALRELMPGIPVILASGYSEDQVMQGIHPELPQAFLEKPYSFDTLRAIIRRTLSEAEGTDT